MAAFAISIAFVRSISRYNLLANRGWVGYPSYLDWSGIMAAFKDAARDACIPNQQDRHRHQRGICGHLSGDRLDSSDVLVSADPTAVHCESLFL